MTLREEALNVQTMRRVDRWIGAPVCAVLTAIRRLGDLFRRCRRDGPPGKIAVIKLAEQGATVLAHSALVRARDMVGAENLYFVVFAENRFILDLLGIVPSRNVLVIRTHGLVRVALDTLRVLRRLRRERVDATVDFEFFARSSAILSYLSGARLRSGYHSWFGEAAWRGDLMTHRLHYNPHLHASEMFQTLVQALESPPDAFPAHALPPPDDVPLPRFEAGSDEVAEVSSMVADELGIADDGRLPSLVLLNANCGDLLPLRRWPERRYIDLARRLLERDPDVRLLLTGSPSEALQAEDLARRIGSARCVSYAGRTTLRQLMILYGLSELMVTNDSGPAHYATLTGIDVIALFGPESPKVFGARTPRSHALWAGLVCSPCVNALNDRQSACRRNVCMEHLGVDRVFARVVEVLEERRSARDDGAAAP